jgi:ketosteroid isomerase-like protein
VGDIEAITALVNSYAERIDAGDLDGVAALFDDATWRSGSTGDVFRGATDVRRVYDRIVLYEDGTPRTRHLLTNLTIELDPGGETASGRCSFTVLQSLVPGEPIQVVVSGRYVDRYRKAEGRWQFADRLFIADLIGDQSRHFV